MTLEMILVNTYMENAKAMAEKNKLLVDDEALRAQMGANARKRAEECFDRKKTYQGLVNVICTGADSFNE